MAATFSVELKVTYDDGEGGEPVAVELTGTGKNLQQAVKAAEQTAKDLLEAGGITTQGSGGGGSR